MLKLNKLFFLILAWKLSLFLLFHTTLFLIGLITRFPFTSGLILIWLTFITLIGVSVLARIINKHSYILLSIFMYYLMYLYYAVSYSKNSQSELLEQLFSNAAFLTSGWYNVMSSFKKSALRTLTYLINNHFIINRSNLKRSFHSVYCIFMKFSNMLKRSKNSLRRLFPTSFLFLRISFLYDTYTYAYAT